MSQFDRAINMGGPSKHRRGSRRPRRTRRVRARKLRQRRWRCVTGAADRRRRDRRRCLCQRRAGELCTVRGKAPLLICPGAASRRGLPYGGSARVSWGFNSVARSSGPAYGAAAAVQGPASSGGRLSLCFPDDEASCCGCCGPGPAYGPVPADRPRCFRRSHARTGRAARCCRLLSSAKCGPGRPLSC